MALTEKQVLLAHVENVVLMVLTEQKVRPVLLVERVPKETGAMPVVTGVQVATGLLV